MVRYCVRAAIFCSLIFLISLILTGCGGGSSAQPPQTATITAQPAAQAISVVLQSPGVGTLSTPLPVHATAASPNGVSGWVVYVDDAAALTLNNSSDTLATSVPMSGGNHTLYVRVWDQGGVNFATSPTLQISVQGTQATVSNSSTAAASSTPPPPAPAAPATPPPASGLPSIPGNATTWTSIQNMDGWQSCSDCAGGKATTSNFWTAAHQSSPSQSGSSREFFIGGHAWSNALWYEKVAPDHTGAAHFLWDFWVRFDSASAAHAHSAEYDMWQALNGQEFMMGSQCNFESGVWDVWDSKNFAWKATSAACNRFSPDTWHHIQWYVERWGSHQYHYGVLVVDGKVYTLDRTYDTNSVGWANSVGVQFQLDQDASGTPLHEWVDNVKLSVW
jgi:hypothetical protein